MDESKKNGFYGPNQKLYKQLQQACTNAQRDNLFEQLLLINTGLLIRIEKKISWRQYASCEYEDIMQIIKMYYIQVILESLESEEYPEYPENVYPRVMRLTQENLSRPYSTNGVAIPYSSRKLLQKNNYEETKNIGAGTSYSGADPTVQPKLELSMSVAKGSAPMEDMLCTRLVLQDILDKQSEQMKEVITDRFFLGLKFKEIGKKNNMSEDHARYLVKVFTNLVRTELELE